MESATSKDPNAAANIRFAAMLADSITIGGKSLMGFGFGGHYSIEHLINFSIKSLTRLQQSADGNKIPALRQASVVSGNLKRPYNNL